MRSDRLMIACIRCSIIRMVTPRSRMSRITADHALDLGRVEPGEHLVEQQQRRLRRERAGQLEPLLAGDGELRRRHVEPVAEADEGGSLFGDKPRRPASDRFSRPKQAPTVQFSSTVMAPSGCTIWCVRASPCARDAIGRHAGDVDAAKHDTAGIRREDAVDEIEQRRLAGAVRADEAEDLVFGDGEAQILHRGETAEALAQVLDGSAAPSFQHLSQSAASAGRASPSARPARTAR